MESTSELQLRSLHEELLSEKATAAQNGTTEQTILHRMARFRQNPFNFAHELYLFIRGVGWRSYDQITGQPVFYNGYTARIKRLVMDSPLLQDKLDELAKARVQQEEKENLLDPDSPTFHTERAKRYSDISMSLTQLAERMVDNMMCKMESKPYIRGSFYMCTQLLTRAYSGVHVLEKEVDTLRQTAKLAAEKKRPIVFLPRHTSHIDYVTLQLICYRLGLTLPVVVAGDNLNFPVVGPFLQANGAMWIRRNFGGDALYTTIVQAYLDTLMQQGYNLECFIEGGRSRTGKLLQPKFGFLSFLLDSVLSGRTEDIWVCPVSMQYDRVIEVDSYVTELLGKPKQKENLADSLSSLSLLGLNLGRIDCRFHEPWSLRAFIGQQLSRLEAGSTLRSHTAADRQHLLRTVGYKTLADINDVSVVMPTALVGTVLLTLRGRGVGRTELGRRVEWLCARIVANKGNVADFHGRPTLQIVDRALAVLGSKLVGTVDGVAEETYYAVDRFQLSFYRNMTIHLFIAEALIAVALYTQVKQGGGIVSEQIPIAELSTKVAFLSHFFRSEFIFPTGQGLQTNFENALEGLIRDQVLDRSEDGSKIGLAKKERQSGRENFDFYCFLLWPFVDAAWLGMVSLLCLTPFADSKTRRIDLKKAQNTAHVLGRTLYHQGDLSYFEAVNTEALKNSYSRAQEEGIIEVTKAKDSTASPTVRIADEWQPERDSKTGHILPQGKLWDFIDNISQHRREGKGRRDSATVSLRVLGLASKLNEQLFKEFETPSDSEASPQVKKGRKRRSKL